MKRMRWLGFLFLLTAMGCGGSKDGSSEKEDPSVTRFIDGQAAERKHVQDQRYLEQKQGFLASLRKDDTKYVSEALKAYPRLAVDTYTLQDSPEPIPVLIVAAVVGAFESAKLILAAGADPDVRYRGRTFHEYLAYANGLSLYPGEWERLETKRRGKP